MHSSQDQKLIFEIAAYPSSTNSYEPPSPAQIGYVRSNPKLKLSATGSVLYLNQGLTRFSSVEYYRDCTKAEPTNRIRLL